jgi:hypothetical protein
LNVALLPLPTRSALGMASLSAHRGLRRARSVGLAARAHVAGLRTCALPLAPPSSMMLARAAASDWMLLRVATPHARLLCKPAPPGFGSFWQHLRPKQPEPTKPASTPTGAAEQPRAAPRAPGADAGSKPSADAAKQGEGAAGAKPAGEAGASRPGAKGAAADAKAAPPGGGGASGGGAAPAGEQTPSSYNQNLLVALTLLVAFNSFGRSGPDSKELTFQEFRASLLEPGLVDHLVVVNKTRVKVSAGRHAADAAAAAAAAGGRGAECAGARGHLF